MAQGNKNNIFVEWALWQFVEMPNFLFAVWKNYFLFAVNYFSAPVLLKTFFSPWKKYNWQYPKNFDISLYAQTFVSNTFSRFLGALMRIALLIIGAFFQAFVAVAGFFVLLAWTMIPFIALIGLVFVFLY